MSEFNWQKVIKYFGSQKDLAKKLKINPSNISMWVRGFKIVPLHHAIKIEELSDGLFLRELMRPDIFVRKKPTRSVE